MPSGIHVRRSSTCFSKRALCQLRLLRPVYDGRLSSRSAPRMTSLLTNFLAVILPVYHALPRPLANAKNLCNLFNGIKSISLDSHAHPLIRNWFAQVDLRRPTRARGPRLRSNCALFTPDGTAEFPEMQDPLPWAAISMPTGLNPSIKRQSRANLRDVAPIRAISVVVLGIDTPRAHGGAAIRSRLARQIAETPPRKSQRGPISPTTTPYAS